MITAGLTLSKSYPDLIQKQNISLCILYQEGKSITTCVKRAVACFLLSSAFMLTYVIHFQISFPKMVKCILKAPVVDYCGDFKATAGGLHAGCGSSLCALIYSDTFSHLPHWMP